ncbi:MAG: Gfo/Idh/MocA family oxidoreductase [Oscillospiraceae bacterium]|nr:Gfo/Idh/MocA family oxidoreductase [Oscillospiraceae bacterium]
MDAKNLKVLFVGLGSIGTRHLKNLMQLAGERGMTLTVDALRSNISRPLREGVAELLDRQFIDPEQVGHYDLIFVTNPTSLHDEVLYWLKGKGECLFIEKPIFEKPDYDLKKLGLGEDQKAYVAAPMRWCGVMLALKKKLPALQPYSVRSVCSSYLPDWRPGVDYRQVYSAHKDLGGGVSIDLIHEWDYLVDLFGMPRQVANFQGQFSHLELDSDDLSVYIARYDKMLAELHLDYFGRTYRRTLELFCKEGTAVADFGAGTLTLPDGTVEHYEEDVNQRYLREMDYFLDYAFGTEKTSLNSPRQALEVLKLTQGRLE